MEITVGHKTRTLMPDAQFFVVGNDWRVQACSAVIQATHVVGHIFIKEKTSLDHFQVFLSEIFSIVI